MVKSRSAVTPNRLEKGVRQFGSWARKLGQNVRIDDVQHHSWEKRYYGRNDCRENDV